MKQCKYCGSQITRGRFCSTKCAANGKTPKLTEALLREEYETRRLQLADISSKYKVSITTICKYLRLYGIEKRGNYIDFSNRQIGRLKVIKAIMPESSGKHVKWLCLCDCGREHIAFSHHLSRSITAQCPTCAAATRRSKEELKKYIWTNIQRSAASRKIQFLLTREWAYELYLQQDKKCKISGVDIVFACCAKDHLEGKTTASLDRIDSSLPYCENNVQWVHKKIQFMKGVLGQSEFLGWCNRVVEYTKR